MPMLEDRYAQGHFTGVIKWLLDMGNRQTLSREFPLPRGKYIVLILLHIHLLVLLHSLPLSLPALLLFTSIIIFVRLLYSLKLLVSLKRL